MTASRQRDSGTKIAEANRRFYARNAGSYDSTETCLVDPRAQAMLRKDLDAIIDMVAKLTPTPKALDACGGTGNVALKLLGQGIPTTVCDLSPELLELFERRCRVEQQECEVVCAEVSDFLSQTDQKYELIVFSSALHHLVDIKHVVSLALKRVVPGGYVFTIFDPTPAAQQSLYTRLLMKLDYYSFKVLKQPRELPGAVLRHLRRRVRKAAAPKSNKLELPLNEDNLGVLAEFHVEAGVDDFELVRVARSCGAEIVWHKRYADARHAVFRWLVASMQEATAFKILLRMPFHKE